MHACVCVYMYMHVHAHVCECVLCVQVTNVGKAFAERYTGFENSVSAQLSLVELRVQRETLATLLRMGLALKTAVSRYVYVWQCIFNQLVLL